MDALPISVNQKQLDLMCEAIEQTIENLKSQQNGGQFNSSDETQKEHNVFTYGTNQYDEAFARVQDIQNQLKSHLESWNSKSDDSVAISLKLDSYQLKLLRSSLEQMFRNTQKGEQTQQRKQDIQSAEQEQLFEDIIEQLPEQSPQEDAD